MKIKLLQDIQLDDKTLFQKGKVIEFDTVTQVKRFPDKLESAVFGNLSFSGIDSIFKISEILTLTPDDLKKVEISFD